MHTMHSALFTCRSEKCVSFLNFQFPDKRGCAFLCNENGQPIHVFLVNLANLKSELLTALDYKIDYLIFFNVTGAIFEQHLSQ